MKIFEYFILISLKLVFSCVMHLEPMNTYLLKVLRLVNLNVDTQVPASKISPVPPHQVFQMQNEKLDISLSNR